MYKYMLLNEVGIIFAFDKENFYHGRLPNGVPQTSTTMNDAEQNRRKRERNDFPVEK